MENNLNRVEIERYCAELGYKSNIFDDIAMISTGVDTWEIIAERKESTRNSNKFLVKHLNLCGNKSQKHHFHKQKYAKDLDYIFNNIIKTHECMDKGYSKMFRIDNLLKSVNL